MPGLEEWLSSAGAVGAPRGAEADDGEQNSAYGPLRRNFFESTIELDVVPVAFESRLARVAAGGSHATRRLVARAHARARRSACAGALVAAQRGRGAGAVAPGGRAAAAAARRRRADSARPGMPAGDDRSTRPGSCQAPGVPRAEHRRLPAADDAGRRAEHLVPKAKFPVIDIHNHTDASTPNNIEQMIREMDALNLRVLVNLERRDTGPARSSRRSTSSELDHVHGSLPRLRQRQLERRRRPGLGREGGGGSRGGGQDRRDRTARSRKGLGLDYAEGRRIAAARWTIRILKPVWDLLRAAQHPGHHPHRRAAGVLLAARHAERALARAGAVRATGATTMPGQLRRSRS